ncbi:hypothetical protein [Hyunsoonleella aestuarii]|uniref:Uncharacterized protein n=1 Tax=Hyunsoonleella aestuarii TaxID=912802 RepID=A0ABP8EEP7_9FLAO|nr:hypothetical protein [Hyunsoonleella aestuarii]
MKNKIFAIIGGTIALFGLGYLIYVIMGFHALTGENVSEVFTKLDLPIIILMEVLYATLIVILFSKWTQINTLSTGAQAGFIIGAFIGGCQTLETLATSDLTDLTGVIIGALSFGVRFGVAGAVIGYFLGRD